MNAVIESSMSGSDLHAMKAEQAIIGVLLSRADLIDHVSQSLSFDDFYFESHQIIYQTMLNMRLSGDVVDLIAVQDKLAQLKLLDRIGGPVYLGNLAVNAPSGANMDSYAETVRERSSRRKLIRAADNIKNAISSSEDVEKSATSGIEEMFRILRNDGALREPDKIGNLLSVVLDDIEKRQAGGTGGIATGFKDLDAALMGGVKPGDVFVIAGRPSMGKTTLGFQIGINAAMNGHSVLAFTLEMSRQQIVERALAQVGGIEFSRIISGNLRDEDYDRMAVAIGKLHEIPFLIDDTGGLSIQDIAARARAQANTSGLSMIIVDYLQIMGYAGRSLSRNEQLGDISRHAKALAKELNVPFILLSQLNRDVEKRQDKRPQMSDLRDSGAIEQDADVIVMMYRDEYYNGDSEFKGMAEAIIRKNRNGSVTTVGLQFDGPKIRFSDL
jgi:replicative DNA helicase